jgi:hypothetical protein
MGVTLDVPVSVLSGTLRKDSGKNRDTMLLLRLPYPYGKKQTWLPMDLMKVSAQLEASGVETTIVDLNLQKMPSQRELESYTYIGTGIIGAPYIPSSKKLVSEVFEMTGKPVMIGGQGVEHFKPEEFRTIYGKSGIQIKNKDSLANNVRMPLPDVYSTTVAPQINLIEAEKIMGYLSHEFSFFVSQGCKYGCDFCAADKGIPEQFNTTIREDLEAICQSASEFWVKNLNMYITSLDLFQNAGKFKDVLTIFADVSREYEIKFTLRGLSRIDSFLDALEAEPELHLLIPKAGLKIVGFGVDGTTMDIWRSQHKGNKSLSDANKAFIKCLSLGIQPEALMVMGFHDANARPMDTRDTLRMNVEFCMEQAESHGVVSRPHVAKILPGSDTKKIKVWSNPAWDSYRATLLNNPGLLRNLDVAMQASEVTHPNQEFRSEVNNAYLEIIRSLTPRNLCGTNPLIPYTGNKDNDMMADTFNMLVPFDK